MTDESLGDTIETVDATPEIDAEDFEWDGFLNGLRSTRRAVKVYQRADLVAQMEEVAGQYRDDLPVAQKRKIRDEVLALREQFEASGRWFVAEARSPERIDKVRREAAERHGITLPPDDAKGEDALIPRVDYNKIERAILADSIVLPTGTTEERLARFAEAAPTEYPKLLVAMRFANGELAQSAGVLTRDFSHAPSAPKKVPGSTKR